MADKYLGIGTEILIGDGDPSSEEFTPIPSLKDFKLPTGKRGELDVTTMDSPGEYKEFIAALKDPGTMSLVVIYDPKDEIHSQLYDLKESGDDCNFQVVLPDAAGNEQYEFAAFVNDFELDLNVEKEVDATIGLRITGAITRTPATP